MRRADETEAAIASIAEAARRTRRPTPRWVWIAAIVVGALAASGFAIAMLGEREPAASSPPAPGSSASSGLGSGLLIGAAIGVVIGFAIARQRRDHSSRNNP